MGFFSFVSKVAISGVAVSLLGPFAVPVGGLVWSGSKIVEETCDDEDVKKFAGFIGDCGRDTITGGAVGLAFQGAGEVLALSSSEAAKVGTKVLGVIERAEGFYSDAVEDVAIVKHGAHKVKGISYLEGCEVCEA